MKKILIALLILCLVLCLRPSYGDNGKGGKGTVAPDFTLKSLNGKNIRLSEHRGEVIVLHFWASWCGSCREEMVFLHSLHNNFAHLGLKVMGLNMSQEAKRVRRFVAKASAQYIHLLDVKSRIAERYRVESVPTTVVVDRDGTIRQRYTSIKNTGPDTIEQDLRELLK